MQKGDRSEEEVGMEHWSGFFNYHVSDSRGIYLHRIFISLMMENVPSGLKHSQLMSLAPRSFALLLLGKIHASPTVTLR